MFPQTQNPTFSHDTDGLWLQPFLFNPTYVHGLDCIPFVVKKGFVVTTTYTIPISLELFTLLGILWRKMGRTDSSRAKGKMMMT
jgi:hypothetical protein